MFAELTESLGAYGATFYRNLLWETGMIGQLLGLEAEEAGLHASGLDRYFDDEAHAAIGIDGLSWQRLYHFAVGGGMEDSRVSTSDPYDPGHAAPGLS
jgi:hypothetical protein